MSKFPYIFFAQFFYFSNMFQFLFPNIGMRSLPIFLPSVKFPNFGNVSCFSCLLLGEKKKRGKFWGKSCSIKTALNIIIIVKPTNSPTQGQSNPRKNRLKVAFEPLFPTAYFFSWVGIDFIYETDCKKPNSNQILRKHVVYERDWRSG